MSLYLGIDIGTSNMKCLGLRTSGETQVIHSARTPTWKSHNKATFFDLKGIIGFVRRAVERAVSVDDVAGIGFSTVGESVVPVSSAGQPLFDPLVWYDPITRETAKDLQDEPGLHDYFSRGITDSYTMGVHKMVWMTQHVVDRSAVHLWLPLSSYLPYALTGRAVWDYSQACRSLLFDVHSRDWDRETIERLNICGSFPSIMPMGSAVGETGEGIPVFLGGHDHIVGINGIRDLFGKHTIFSSMGSASVMGGIVDADPEQIRAQMSTVENLIVGVPRDAGEYYVEMSLRYVGKLLEMVARVFGGGDSGASFYERMNGKLLSTAVERAFPLLVEGDLVAEERTTGTNLFNFPVDGEILELVHSLYLYFSVMTLIVDERLNVFFEKPRVVLGGGVTKNRVLMRYIANALERPVELLSESELSALGAALLPAYGMGDNEIYEAAKGALTITNIDPDDSHLCTRTTVEQYRGMLATKAASLGG